MSHPSQEAERVAAKFVKGEAAKSPLVNILDWSMSYVERKGRRVTTDGNTIKSYDWWVIAHRDENDPSLIWLTNDRYQTGEWKSGKPKYSPTTDGHIRAVELALHSAGYRETGEDYSVFQSGQLRYFVGMRKEN